MRREKRVRRTIIIRPSIIRRGKRLATRQGRLLYAFIEECLETQFAAMELAEGHKIPVDPEK